VRSDSDRGVHAIDNCTELEATLQKTKRQGILVPRLGPEQVVAGRRGQRSQFASVRWARSRVSS
jgi:hypothetical protein